VARLCKNGGGSPRCREELDREKGRGLKKGGRRDRLLIYQGKELAKRGGREEGGLFFPT